MRTLRSDPARRRLLIVDTNRRNFDELRDVFTRRGHECEVALDGATARSILAERTMDMVIINVEAAGGDAEEFVVELKEADPDMALVLFNGTSGKTEQRRLRRLGASSCLSKASDLRAVVRAVDRALAPD
jgi:DNA-binding NtrC family response regulator